MSQNGSIIMNLRLCVTKLAEIAELQRSMSRNERISCFTHTRLG